jgi:hypothetical protein
MQWLTLGEAEFSAARPDHILAPCGPEPPNRRLFSVYFHRGSLLDTRPLCRLAGMTTPGVIFIINMLFNKAYKFLQQSPPSVESIWQGSVSIESTC